MDNKDFKRLSLIEIVDLLKTKKVTQDEIRLYFLDRIKKYNDKLQAFNLITDNSDNKVSLDTKFAWAPIAIKDMFCEKWVLTTNSTILLKDFKPPYTATVLDKLFKDWAISLWHLTHDPFGMWSAWIHSMWIKANNPWDIERIPGGSSSWSATAVAAWLIPAALWTDTGWSCRQPASMCWIVWFRPTYWKSSRWWIIAYASSLDTPGTLCKTVKDTAFLFETMAWLDEKDSTTLDLPVKINKDIWNKKDLKWIKVWVPSEYFAEWLNKDVETEIKKAINKLEELWAEIVDISMPYTKYALATYYITIFAEASTNLARYDWIRYWEIAKDAWNIDTLFEDNRTAWLWDEAKRRILLWSFVLSSWFYDDYYIKASKVRELVKKDFIDNLNKVDIIVWPVSPEAAWKRDDEKASDPIKEYLADIYSVPMALAWVPCLSVPAWYVSASDDSKTKLPVWIQMIANQNEEEKLFMIANIFEQANKEYIESEHNKYMQ